MTLSFSINFNSLLHYRAIERDLEEYTEDWDLDAMLGGNKADAQVGPALVMVAA
jgi:hypothetical protein